MNLSELRKKLEKKKALLSVIGLGYVGLPVAAMLAEAGFDVTGVEIRAERVDKINRGICPIEGEEPGLADLLKKVVRSNKLRATANYTDLKDRDVILIDVETPVDDRNTPRYEALRAALKSLAPVLKPGALVIIESTIAPETIKNVVLPLLEQNSGKKVNVDFYLGNCPERVMPGKLLQNLRTLSRVCGGMTPETADTMLALYRHIVKADLDPSDCITAELVKTAENAYRDVQIAFANEVAMICEAVGADVWRVRELVNKSPNRQMHMPGAGVGGHCIPKDPWLLAYGVKDKKVDLRIIPAARAVNDAMPLHMVDLLKDALAEAGRKIKGSRIAVLGYAYLEDSDDIRNSPSEVLVSRLRKLGAEILIQDPWVEEYQRDVMECVKGCDAVVIMVAHSAYQKLDLKAIKADLNTPILIDGRNVFKPAQAKAAGLSFRGVGKGEIIK
jgi:UDP-N-acetyl-D-mannosaminuronic acid dehydrogenase